MIPGKCNGLKLNLQIRILHATLDFKTATDASGSPLAEAPPAEAWPEDA